MKKRTFRDHIEAIRFSLDQIAIEMGLFRLLDWLAEKLSKPTRS